MIGRLGRLTTQVQQLENGFNSTKEIDLQFIEQETTHFGNTVMIQRALRNELLQLRMDFEVLGARVVIGMPAGLTRGCRLQRLLVHAITPLLVHRNSNS